MQRQPDNTGEPDDCETSGSAWANTIASIVFSVSNFAMLTLYGKIHFRVMMDERYRPREGDLLAVSLELLATLARLRWMFAVLALIWAVMALGKRPLVAGRIAFVVALLSLMSAFLMM